jgi:hypothetical protein
MTVGEIGQWLKSLGLTKYIAKFAEEEIDGNTAANFTDNTLKELGLKMGERNRIINAIQQPTTTKQDLSISSTSSYHSAVLTSAFSNGRYSTPSNETVIYKGMLGFPPNYVPKFVYSFTSCSFFLHFCFIEKQQRNM